MTSTADLAVLVPAAREPGAPAGTDPDMTAIEVYVAEMTAKAGAAAVRERPGQAPRAVARLTAQAVQTSCSYRRSCRQVMRTVSTAKFLSPSADRDTAAPAAIPAGAPSVQA
jgi:hypothetical protein